MNDSNKALNDSALTTLFILQLSMLIALYTKTAPHPPNVVPLFAIAPYIAVALSALATAIITGSISTRTGRAFSVISAIFALLSYGPQKYFDAAFGQIWPAVIAGQISAVTIFFLCLRTNKQ